VDQVGAFALDEEAEAFGQLVPEVLGCKVDAHGKGLDAACIV
jgi:hypothetical protein